MKASGEERAVGFPSVCDMVLISPLGYRGGFRLHQREWYCFRLKKRGNSSHSNRRLPSILWTETVIDVVLSSAHT